MPLRLNIGLNKKVGEANYGSRGASVNLDIELDSQLVGDPAKLQDRIRQCFGMVRASLDEELNGGNGNGHGTTGDNTTQEPRSAPAGNGNTSHRGTGGNGPRPATQSQVKAIHAIARRQKVNVASFLRERFQVSRPDDLSIGEASQIIDELKSETSNGS